MTTFGKAKRWVESNRDICLDVLRVYLGIALFLKGLVYLRHVTMLTSAMNASEVPFSSSFLAHYVALAHLGGGLLLAYGLWTRFAEVIQVPVLLGAVLFVHLQEGLFTQGQTLEFSLLVLFLLGLFAFCGSGRLSVDYYFSGARRVSVARTADAAHRS
jgi:putative oxidoreductase